jgi:4-aminobutyrate aminotransferase-like enzyme
VKAVKKQLASGSHCAFPDFYAELPVTFAEILLSNMPPHLKTGKAFLSNSGTESIECAIKLAKWTKRGKYVIAFDRCFHGRTYGSLSMTNCSALFMEPIQGEGGYVVPPKEFPKGVKKLCEEYDILYCDDEVQAGCWRTGKFLAIENFGVKPDIVSLSKAVGGGMPLGVTVARHGLMKWPGGAHSNTFGGNLASCASGIATLNYMKKKKLSETS